MALTARELKIYHFANSANDAFQRELVRVYGSRRAGDMRYRTSQWKDARLKHAADRSRRATDRWIKAFRAANARTPVGTRSSNPARKHRGPPRGQVPPHLRKYLFKKGHR